MTQRERWIVYPLLFLAIGASLRDKLFNLTTSKRIVCEELIVVDGEGDGNRPLARIGASERTEAHPVREGQMFVSGQLIVDQARVGDDRGRQLFVPRDSVHADVAGDIPGCVAGRRAQCPAKIGPGDCRTGLTRPHRRSRPPLHRACPRHSQLSRRSARARVGARSRKLKSSSRGVQAA